MLYTVPRTFTSEEELELGLDMVMEFHFEYINAPWLCAGCLLQTNLWGYLFASMFPLIRIPGCLLKGANSDLLISNKIRQNVPPFWSSNLLNECFACNNNTSPPWPVLFDFFVTSRVRERHISFKNGRPWILVMNKLGPESARWLVASHVVNTALPTHYCNLQYFWVWKWPSRFTHRNLSFTKCTSSKIRLLP